MTLNKDQQTELDYLCDREATVCAIVEVLLDHKLMTCDEFLTLKKKHFDNLKPAVEEAVEHFAEPEQPAQVEGIIDRQIDNELGNIQCNINIGVTADSYNTVSRMIDKLKAVCTGGNYTFNVDFKGQFGTNVGGVSAFNWNFQFPTMV